MSASEDQATLERKVRVSLILPIAPGHTLSAQQVIDYRQALAVDSSDNERPVEVLVATTALEGGGSQEGNWKSDLSGSQLPALVTVPVVDSKHQGWASLAGAAFAASTGDHLIVMDPRRRYSPASLAAVAARLETNDCDLAVGTPRLEDVGLLAWLQVAHRTGACQPAIFGDFGHLLGTVCGSACGMGP